jgi:hypothetical protein
MGERDGPRHEFIEKGVTVQKGNDRRTFARIRHVRRKYIECLTNASCNDYFIILKIV